MLSENKYWISKILINGLGPAGLYRITSNLTRQYPRILMYHRFSERAEIGKVSAHTLNKQITEIKKHYSILPLSVIVGCLQTKQPFPDNAVVLTIDDGYADFYNYAYPVLKSHNVPATIYVTTRFISRDIWLWPDMLTTILRDTHRNQLIIELNGKTENYNLATIQSRKQTWHKLISKFMRMPPESRDNKVTEIAALLDIRIDPVPTMEFSAMSWDDVREIAENGIEIGAHTRTHPVLSTLDREQAMREIAGARSDIEQEINRKITSFCYPNGQIGDYTPETKDIIEESGYTNAVTAFHDNQNTDDKYEIKRHGISENMYLFKRIIYGIEYLHNLLWRKIGNTHN